MGVIKISEINTPLGEMTSVFTSKGLAVLSFSKIDSFEIPGSLKDLEVSREIDDRKSQLEAELNDYFNGNPIEFKTPLDLHGTDFQLRVWNALLDVPYGTKSTYKQQALRLGDVKAIRAVASANGSNPVAILVPCHRIVGSDNSLTGYAGELWRKKELLDLESRQMNLFQ